MVSLHYLLCLTSSVIGSEKTLTQKFHVGVLALSFRYKEIPPISRLYLTGAFLSTAACAAEMVSPYQLYFNYDLVLKGQFWRLITSYLYFGAFSVDFLFHMYFLARYSRLLEESDFRGRTANYILFLLFGIVGISIMASYLNVNFLGQSLTFMMA